MMSNQSSFRSARFLPVFKERERMRWFSLGPSPEDLMNVGNQERIVLKAKYNKYTEQRGGGQRLNGIRGDSVSGQLTG